MRWSQLKVDRLASRWTEADRRVATVVKAREVNRRIERLGGVMVRQVGSHRRYAVVITDDTGVEVKAATTVPQHAGDIPVGTLRAIERDLEALPGKGWLR